MGYPEKHEPLVFWTRGSVMGSNFLERQAEPSVKIDRSEDDKLSNSAVMVILVSNGNFA